MLVREILQTLSELAPFEYAESWDNSGLLVGRQDKEVKRIYIAIDATDEIIDDAIRKRADLLLTHHPLIFSSMKQVVSDDFVGRRIIKLISSDMSYIAMHTNFDIMGMADAAADSLSLKNCEVLETIFEDDIAKAGYGRIGSLSYPMTLEELAREVKKAFNLPNVRIFGAPETTIATVGIFPGSGGSGIEPAINGGADVLITGDIKHHEGIDAVARELAIIDAGHYGIEKLFISYMEEYIQRRIKDVMVITEEAREPFIVV